MRAFFCIELSDELKENLNEVILSLKQKVAVKVNWVKKENLHVTLKFLGEIDPEMIENLKAAAEEAKAQIQPFQWEIDELGCFPNLKRPRVIWAGSEKESEETYRLYKSLEQALIPLGFEPEEKYIPHITLGRVKEGKRKQLEGLGALIFEERFSFSAEANAITLMESQLTPTGPIYKPIFRLDF